ncbi:MAG: ATP-binding protein [Acidobacteria bacterium]|nr:MAG: ATP-binding protein [Acidobacteriota bacterium]
MYHPYFRGKQYELITIREMASILGIAGFRPIIEPVREDLIGLEKALHAVVHAGGKAIVIVNPHHGDLSGAGEPLTELLKHNFLDTPGISAGILLKQNMTLEEVLAQYKEHAPHSPVLIHAGFGEAKALTEELGKPKKNHTHIFFEDFCGKLYQRHFSGANRILLRDGFKRMRNKDYDRLEPFSDLHATFEEEGMNGFGDFLIVGDEYSEEGGPAYAIAIHLTFIDPDQDNLMQIYHFKSQRTDTPKDPAGKFAEALAVMMKTLDGPNSKVLETDAVKEFRALHEQAHFPGLGYVKKLSMSHHIETMADYFKKAI